MKEPTAGRKMPLRMSTGAGLARTITLALVVLAILHVLGSGIVRQIVVSKSGRSLIVYGDGGRVLERFPVGLGRNPEGPKQREGDERTPEGEYYVCFKNTQSRFHLSLGLSYPGPADAAAGLADGVIGEAERHAIEEAHRRRALPPWKTALGGEIFIHGGLADHDSTAGCIALDDRDIEQIFPLVAIGTPVRIEP